MLYLLYAVIAPFFQQKTVTVRLVGNVLINHATKRAGMHAANT